MRVLNKKQKRLIDQWFDKKWTGPGSICSINNMPEKLIEKLEQFNFHEIIYDNINRYITEKAMKKVYIDDSR